jgi:hypothetical protein
LAALSLGFALAQDEAAPTASDPALDALSQEQPRDELDALSDPVEEARARKPVSVTIRALDKITARYKDVEAKIGEPVKFGSLEILPRYCDKRPPEEFPETTAFLEIYDRDFDRARAVASVEARNIDGEKEAKTDYAIEEIPPLSAQGTSPPVQPNTHAEQQRLPTLAQTPVDTDRIFTGWMFASSPALNALEHPVYDVWVIDCKTAPVDR